MVEKNAFYEKLDEHYEKKYKKKSFSKIYAQLQIINGKNENVNNFGLK